MEDENELKQILNSKSRNRYKDFYDKIQPEILSSSAAPDILSYYVKKYLKPDEYNRLRKYLKKDTNEAGLEYLDELIRNDDRDPETINKDIAKEKYLNGEDANIDDIDYDENNDFWNRIMSSIQPDKIENIGPIPSREQVLDILNDNNEGKTYTESYTHRPNYEFITKDRQDKYWKERNSIDNRDDLTDKQKQKLIDKLEDPSDTPDFIYPSLNGWEKTTKFIDNNNNNILDQQNTDTNEAQNIEAPVLDKVDEDIINNEAPVLDKIAEDNINTDTNEAQSIETPTLDKVIDKIDKDGDNNIEKNELNLNNLNKDAIDIDNDDKITKEELKNKIDDEDKGKAAVAGKVLDKATSAVSDIANTKVGGGVWNQIVSAV